jgi:hypothetical protein
MTDGGKASPGLSEPFRFAQRDTVLTSSVEIKTNNVSHDYETMLAK